MRLSVILGAGASVGAGLPTLKNVFKDKDVRNYLKADADELQKYLTDHVWGPRGLDLERSDRGPTIEEILTYLKLGENSRHDKQTNNLWRTDSPLIDTNYRTVTRQLLGCVYHAVYAEKGHSENTNLNDLIVWADKNFAKVDWLTFNWDAKLEQAFYYVTKYDLMDGGMPECSKLIEGWSGPNQKHSLTKMHGSVTWFRDTSGNVRYKRFGVTKKRVEVKDAWAEYLKQLSTDTPVIAEPNHLKHDSIPSDRFLASQWDRMRQALLNSHALLIVGYSLPDGDMLAKQMLNVIFDQRIRLRKPSLKYMVIDPYGQRAGVFDRFEKILGPQAIESAESNLQDCWPLLKLAFRTD